MGAKTLQRLAAENDARSHLSKGPRRTQFKKNMAESGLKTTLLNRDAPFGDGFVRVRAADMAASDSILIENIEAGVRRITLNRPETLNVFTFPMYLALLDALAAIARDANVRVVILTGAGRGFCSGHDLKNAGPSPFGAEGLGNLYARRHSLMGPGAILIAMRNLPQPLISAVNGTAAGIGYVLVLAADMAIAGRSAKFINTIHKAATGAELGMSYRLPRAIGAQRAAELLNTARPVLANEAEPAHGRRRCADRRRVGDCARDHRQRADRGMADQAVAKA